MSKRTSHRRPATPPPTEAEIAEACKLCGISPGIRQSWCKQFGAEAFNREVIAVSRVVRSPFGTLLRALEATRKKAAPSTATATERSNQ